MLSRLRSTAAPTWYDAAYRLPLTASELPQGVTRRPDLALWFLRDRGVLTFGQLRTPRLVTYEELGRVHTERYLEEVTSPEVLGWIFSVEPSGVPVDELLGCLRMACGGTLLAARAALEMRAPTLNLLGGFHHASPDRGGAFCVFNDVAVALARLRADGFQRRVAVLDLDAHPPDGTAACLAGDRSAWIGSLSGSDWGPLAGVDETLLPAHSSDAAYLDALSALLRRMPEVDLAFVIAGGDVLGGDQLGTLELTLAGARERDRRVRDALGGLPSVWLPGGGYHPDAWRVLAGTALVLAGRARARIPDWYDPLHTRFRAIARQLSPEDLGNDARLTEDDVAETFGMPRQQSARLLDYYSKDGIEYALSRLGILRHIERLGYTRLRVEIDPTHSGRVQLLGRADGVDHVLVELVLERRHTAEHEFLFVNWLSLRHPRTHFSDLRPRLPGQEVPGLGLAEETMELLALIARRLQLDGVASRPSWYHIAYATRHWFRFVDPHQQGRFEAMIRDFAGRPLLEITTAIAAGRARMNGEPYTWEADDVVYWLRNPPRDEREVAAEKARVRFTLDDQNPVLSEGGAEEKRPGQGDE